jgi:hypothetical protein
MNPKARVYIGREHGEVIAVGMSLNERKTGIGGVEVKAENTIVMAIRPHTVNMARAVLEMYLPGKSMGSTVGTLTAHVHKDPNGRIYFSGVAFQPGRGE